MKRRDRRIVWMFAFAASAGALTVEACGFPEVTFAPEAASEAGVDGAVGEDGPRPDATTSDGPAAETSVNPDVDPEGGTKDASSAGDAAKVDASGCRSCDCDNDTFNRLDLPAGCDGGPGGKLPDCDDLNPAIHPGLGFISDPWPFGATTHTPVGDWDCSGATTKQFNHNAACGLLSTCSDGFVGDPACGATADFITCGPVLPAVGCAEETRMAAGVRTQGCH